MLSVDGDRILPEEWKNLVVTCENVDIVIRQRVEDKEPLILKIPCEPGIKYVRILRVTPQASGR